MWPTTPGTRSSALPRISPLRLAAVAAWIAIGGQVAGAAEPGRVPVPTVSAASTMARLQAWLDGTRDLEARFQQTLLSGALGTGVVESGSLFLLRPGRLRWDYSRPERKVAIIHGDLTRLYLEQDRQLWEGRLDAMGRMLPALLAGTEPLSALFVPEAVEPVEAGQGRMRLRLLPADPGDFFEVVIVEIEADASIVGAEVLDGSGNRMAYRFSGIRRNRGLSARVFDFEPPRGTERIRQP